MVLVQPGDINMRLRGGTVSNIGAAGNEFIAANCDKVSICPTMRYYRQPAILHYTYPPCRVPVTYVGWSSRHVDVDGQQSTLACSPQDLTWNPHFRLGSERVHNRFSSVHITGVSRAGNILDAALLRDQ